MLNFSVNKGVNLGYGYENYLLIKSKNKEQNLKQITDNDYKNYSSAISAMNKPIVSFGANNYTTKLSPKNAQVREKIFQIDGYCFEKLAGFIFKNAQNENGEKLFDNVEITRASGDGGVDILLEKNQKKSNNGVDIILDNKKQRILVQCKHFQKGHCVDIETMQALADCREKEMFQRNYKKEDINCLMIASSGVNNNVLTEYMPTVKDFDYKIMNLDNLIDFAKKHKVKIDDEVLNPLIEETKERSLYRQELLSQKGRIKEMINDNSMTIDEVIQTLNSEFKSKYPYFVKGNYISDFIKHTFNPPECFDLLKQEGYKFEENLSGKGGQTIFSVKKDNETFIVYYSDANKVLSNYNIDKARNSIDKAIINEDYKSILISKNGFSEGKKTNNSLKNFDKVYTIFDGKLQEYDRIPEKLKPIVNLLKQEGFEFENNLCTGTSNIFSVKKDNETFVVLYSDSNSALCSSKITRIKDYIDKATINEDYKSILISPSGFRDSKKTSDSLKNFDKVYTVVDDKLQEYDGIPEKLRNVVNLLQKEGYEFEENLGVSSQNTFSMKKDNETFVMFYSDRCEVLSNNIIDSAKNSIDQAKKNKNDKTILISKSGFRESKKTSDSLKNFDKVYTVDNDKLQEYDVIPEKLRPIVDLLQKEDFEFVENLNGLGGQAIFSVKKGNETFVVYYCENTINCARKIDRAKNCIDKAKKNKDDKTIYITKNGFSEGKETSDSLKNFDKVYTIVDGKLQEYDGIPEKLRPIVNLLQKEGFEFKENLSTNPSQNVFSVKKGGKTFIVSCSKQNTVLGATETNKLLKSISNISENKDGIILVTKNGMLKSCKEGFEEKTITDENGNKYIVYTKDLTQEQKTNAV